MLSTDKSPLWIKLLPGGLYTTASLFGGRELARRITNMGVNSAKVFLYLLQNKGLHEAYSYLYTKTFVPVGEGAGAAAYLVLAPLIRRFPMLAPYPRYIEIETTTICNKRCIHCENTYWKDQERRHMSFAEFKTIVDQFPNLTWVNLTGEGSAFTNPAYLKMVRYLKSKHVAVYIVDHFDDLDQEQLEQLIQLGVNGFYISVDGASAEVYDKIKVGCKFDRVMGNIKKFLELKQLYRAIVPEVNFRYVILEQNKHEIPAFIDLVASLGDRTYWGESRVGFVGNFEFEENKHLSASTVSNDLLDKAIQRANHHKLNVFFTHIEKQRNPPIDQCIAWLEPYIFMGGHVAPCCSVFISNNRTFLRNNSLGNVFEMPFREIWKSQKYRQYRWLVNKPDQKVPNLCQGCRVYDTSSREREYGVEQFRGDSCAQHSHSPSSQEP